MKKQGKNWKSFDGSGLLEGQVLVPQMVSPEDAEMIGAVMENMRLWNTAGVRYWVMFIPVVEDAVDLGWKAFWADVNELLDVRLGPGRRGRCVVSLDALMDMGYLSVGAVPSAESVAMDEILPVELAVDLGQMNPMFSDIVRLGYQGIACKEIIDRLPVRKSQAYDVYRKCRAEAERWLESA